MAETIRIKLGGCGLNTTLVYQLNHKDTATIFCGSIGNDKNGSLLKKMMETSQIQSFFYINDSKPTGRTFNFIDCEKKTLLCHCEAPKYFPLNYLKDNLHMVDECAVVYTTNFFESKDCSKYLATYCSSKNILFSFNLSNPLYVSINAEFIKQIWPEIDILFGNLSEYEALVEIFNLQKDDINNSIKYLSNLNNKPHSKKLIVITNDQHPCIICDGSNVLFVPALETDQTTIYDTSGCGDAFVGGFLYEYLNSLDLEKSANSGHYYGRLALTNYRTNTKRI